MCVCVCVCVCVCAFTCGAKKKKVYFSEKGGQVVNGQVFKQTEGMSDAVPKPQDL